MHQNTSERLIYVQFTLFVQGCKAESNWSIFIQQAKEKYFIFFPLQPKCEQGQNNNPSCQLLRTQIFKTIQKQSRKCPFKGSFLIKIQSVAIAFLSSIIFHSTSGYNTFQISLNIYQLSHSTEWNMGNISRVYHILQTYLTSLQASEIAAKYEKRGKHIATCDNWFIISSHSLFILPKKKIMH